MPDQKKEKASKNKTPITDSLGVEICDDQATHYFTNFILTIQNIEEIILGIGNRKIKNPNEVEINSYYHLTIPHLKRLAKLLSDKVNDIEKEKK